MNVPKLRFPEFLGAGEWTDERLETKTKKVGSGITPTGGDKNYKQSGRPFVRSQNIGWGNLLLNDVAFIDEKTHNSFISTQIAAYDVLLNITGASIGRSAVADSRIEGGNVNQHVCIIRVTPDELSSYFLNQYLISQDGQKQIDSFQAGGNRQGLNFEQIRSLLIPLPTLFAEQQKIASCLSSLDELVTAETQKLAALKDHKKGLMQQLFPQAGETTPRVRFAEFLGAGEWKDKKLLDLAENGFSNGVFNDPKKVGSGYKLINVLDMYLDTTINEDSLSLVELSISEFQKNKVEYGDVFFTRSSLVKAGIAQSNIYLGQSEDVTFDGHLIRLRANTSIVTPMFLHYALKTEFTRSQLIAKGKTATMTTIGQSDIAGTNLFHPSLPEQQKIANCLSSLDELITAQTRKIDALKTHKKGLMQGLFPNPSEEVQP
jgi:type I restriction enzyme S subunit